LKITGFPESTQRSAGGMFFIGEAGTRWEGVGDQERPGHAGIGAWFHNGTFPRTSGEGATRGAGGGYAFLDQTLFLDKTGPTRDLGAIFIAGLADKTASPIDQSLMAGLNAAGFVPGRPDDEMGVLCSWAHLPAEPGLLHPFEMASEIYYKIQVTPWASLKPDFQYIINPSGKRADAAVVTVRAEIDF
jgi:porin